MKTKQILSLVLTLVMICGLLPMNIFKAEAATSASGTLLDLSNYSGYPDHVYHTFTIRIKTTNDCDASAANCEASWVAIYGSDGDIYLNKSLMHNVGNTLEVTYTSYIYPYAAQLALGEDMLSSRDYACDVTVFCDGEEIDTVNLYATGGDFSDAKELYFTESHASFPSISDGLIVPSSTSLTASRNSTVNNSISFYAKTKDGADAYDPGYSAKTMCVKSGNVTASSLDGRVPASSVKLVNTSNQAVTIPGISVNTSYKRVEVGPEFISGYNGTSATFKVSAQVGMHSSSYFWGGLKTIYSSPITVTKPTYTVNFNKNGGEGGSMAPQTLYYGNDSNKANLSANAFTKTGYTFDGWSLNANGSGTRYADKASVLNLTTGSSVTLYAQWKLNEYSVSYEKNKPAATSNQVTGTMANSSHTYSVAKNILANQYSLIGYTFNGWNTIANGGGTAYANAASVINLTTVNGATVPFYAQWIPHTYTVAYNQNKPANASTTVTGTTENSSHIYDVAKNITPNEYALTGYTFKGWNTASNGSGTSYANNASVKNLTATDGATVTLYAKWDANEYDITFHEEGGSTVSDQAVVFDSTTNNEVAVPTREGYTFNGWFTQQSGGTKVYNADGTCAKNTAYWDANGKWIKPDGETLYAQWTANTYTLTYDTKGGSPLEDQTVTFDSPYIGESPERVGYIFDRWFKDTAYTQPITIGSTLVKTAADHSIYAKWNPITYKIYYADGTNTVKVQNAKYGEAFNLPLASTLNLTPPANHHFVGWNNLSADATTVTYADGQRITTGLTTINNDSVNLFAVWAPNDTYRVVYDPNGGSGSPKDNNSYYEGNTVSINFATPTRPGYQFSGWSKEADTAVPIYTQTGTTYFEMGDENVTLYAVWKPIGYTVKYHTGTAETLGDTACTYDVEAVLNDGSTLTKDDYTFKGWAISQDSNVVTYAPGAKVLNLSNINGAEIDLYAVWQEDGKIRLSYNANGGYGAPEYQENYAGKVLTVSNIVPVRENYTFLGWDEDAEATSATYHASDSFTLGSSNTVLYAVWKKNPSLTYHANGGLFEEAIATSYPARGSDVVFASVKPVRSGYTFLGWNTDKTATSALTSLVMPEGNTVLYAVWEIDQYTVELPAPAEGYSVFYDGTEVTAPKSVLTDNGAKVSFEVVIAEGYSPKNMNVVFGNVALGYISLSGNIYTYETPIITSDGVIEVRGVEEITFPITLNNGTGFTVSPANQIVSYNKTLEFKVTLDDAYALTAPTVYVDGNSITGVKNGNEYTYTVNNIISQPMISVSATKNPQHTAIFVSGGSVYTFSTVEDQSRLTEPAAPERAGYTFGGWYTEKECTNQYNFETSVTDDVVLYAKWIANTYNVSYELNGALGTVPLVQTKTHDVTLKLSESTPERDGYSFKGWNTEANGLGTPYGAGSEYIANASATLYAQWEKNVYTITLIKDTGVNAQISANTAKHGDTVTLTVSAQDNYKNPVISANPASNATLVSGTTYTITGPVSFSVTATPKTVYTYTFNAEGKLHYSQSAIEGSGDTVVLPTEPLKEGYTFKGWYIGNTQVTETTVIDSDKTVVAQWTINEYEVTPAANGDGYQVTTNEADNKVNYEDSYRFKVTIANGYNAEDMRVYANGAILVPTVSGNTYSYTIEDISEDVSVVVNGVKKNVYTVTYYVEGGIYYSEQVTHGEVTTAPVNTPVKLGESFASWQKNGADWNFADAIEENTTLVAKFSANTVTVTPASNGEGYAVESNNSATLVYGNNSYEFSVTVAEHYNAENLRVYANGNYLVPAVSGNVYTYTLTDITENTTIMVEGIQKDVYTVSYYVDNVFRASELVIYNEKATQPTNPTADGKTFAGWSTGSGIFDFDTLITQDTRLDAVWAGDTYTVTPATDGDGYTVSTSETDNIVDYGGAYSFKVNILDHYNAKDMKVYANGILLIPEVSGNQYHYTIKNVTADMSVTVTGVKKDVYKVEYIVDGATYRSEAVEYGKKATRPTSPVKQGETFKEWVNGGAAWNFDSEITQNLTLTATWTTDGFVVVLPDDGTGYDVSTSGNVSVNYGDDVTFTITILEHYNAESMKVYANGALILPSISGNVYTYTVKNVKVDTTVTVTDVKPDIYTVTFIADGETVHTEKVVYQNKLTAPKTPVKAGYEFDCWTYNSVEWDFNTEIDVDIDLIAKFTPITYQVTLPQNTVGYTLVQTSSENPVTYDNEFTFDVIVDEAHNADDMRVYANGILLEATGENGSTVSFRIPNVKETTVVTVKGIGTNTYAVTYKANTAEYVGNMPEGFIKTHDEDCVISDLTPERHGYNFLGWSVAADGSVDYDPAETYSDNSDLILYAVWEAKQFTVEFVTNGGTINGVGISEYTYGTGAILPGDVTFTGFDFAGWYEDELMQGVKVTEITLTDYGNKKYYAAYTIADVVVNGYTGEYDGAYHLIDFSLTDALKVPVEKYQWYFIPEGTNTAIAVDSDSYNEYKVKDVAQNGEYYCYIETVLVDSDISVHFLTNKATVTITKKPVTIKAEDASKVYDATALTTNTVLLADGSALVSEHTMSGVMTDVSTITNVGSQDNIIDAITVLDSEGKDVTDNYEITTQNGTLTITPATLSVVANNVSKSVNATLTENELYKISGQYGSEMLSLANVTITGKNQNNEDVALGDVTKNAGTYQMTINYDGFSGDGNENYMGTGTITSVVTVYRRSGGGGGGSATPTYTVKYESNGGSDVESVKLTSGKVAQKPETPVKDGYTFDGWYLDKELTTAYDFETKVTKSFTLYAKWGKVEEQEPENTDTHNCPSKAFADLDIDAWYHEAVDYALENGIFKGVGGTTFAPNDKLTRAMLVTVLYRMENEPATNRSIPFSDIDMGAYYANAVSWAKQNGIVNGVTENEFAPDESITREQIAAIIMRYAVYKGMETITLEENLHFSDADEIYEYAASAMNWAVGAGLINGKSESTLAPKDNATRAEVAAILHRFMEANK